MKIIISPAKKMKQEEDLDYRDLPVYLDRAEEIHALLKTCTLSECQALWKCNDAIATLNYERIQAMNLKGNLSPALFTYEGIQYRSMAPGAMNRAEMEYVQEHLRILSGFYGILRPFDGITPYRLEMLTKLSVKGSRDLYDYWGDALYTSLTKDDHVLLNLASKEYSKCIEKYLTGQDTFITVVFGEEQNGKIKQKATMAKMARGAMVRFLAEQNADAPEACKAFQGEGFRFSEEHSDETTYTFLRES